MRTMAREQRKVIESLRHVALFANCSDAELTEIDGLVSEISIDTGRTLMSAGDGGLEFVVVVDGWASVTRDDEEIAKVGPGSFVGELALIDKRPRTATVTAITPMRLWVLHEGEFATLLGAVPCVKKKIEAAAGRRRRG
ncbi:MAG TPA: cyclic nucleotide-binding domain-containing protein [Acidimicrobiia bacterium]|nr:cyclic nucleotide-binding domain-containing protein [Acidimicrobiia bacterium]